MAATGLISTVATNPTTSPSALPSVADTTKTGGPQPVPAGQPVPVTGAPTITGGPAAAPNVTPANVASVAAPVAAAPRTIDPNETVAGQMNKLLTSDSPYLQSARSHAMELANQRGLINSSLATGAAERAAIDAATPIAQQDATTYANSAQLAQQGNQDLQLTGYKSLLDSAQQQANFGYTTAENQQNIEANTELQNARLRSQEGLQKEAEQAALQQQTQQQKATADLQTSLKQMDINLDLTKMDATARDALTTATAPIIQQVQAEISQIQRMTDQQMTPDAKAKAIDQQNAYLRANIQTLSTLYGYKLDWPAGTGAQETIQNDNAASSAQKAEQAAQQAQQALQQLQQQQSPYSGGY